MSNDNEFKASDYAKLMKGCASLLSLLVLLIWGFVEFTLNPNKNVTYYLEPGKSYYLFWEGCLGEHPTHVVYIDTIVKEGKKYIANGRTWIRDNSTPEQPITLRGKQEWTVSRCGETDAQAALVWDVYSDKVFLRVHQGFEIGEAPE